MSLKQWLDKGFKSERKLQHYRTIQAMPLILGEDRKKDAQYLDACRSKRNIAEYNRVGVVTERDAEELVQFVKEFKNDVINWLKKNCPNLI